MSKAKPTAKTVLPMNLIFEGLKIRKPKRTLAETEWAKGAQKKQASSSGRYQGTRS